MKISENAKKELIEWGKDILFSLICAGIILFFFMPTVVQQHSMDNTLSEGDYLFISRQSYHLFGKPQRGDIIVFQSGLKLTAKKDKLLIKRIIGLPGDTVAISNGEVILNGEILKEDYTRDGYTNGDMAEVTVPEGKLFVMGDNRQNSADSRSPSIGMVDLETVKGKAVLRLFPIKNFGGIYK